MNFQKPHDRRQSRFAGTGYRWSYKYDDEENELGMFWNPEDFDKPKGIKFGPRLSTNWSGRMSRARIFSRTQSQQFMGGTNVFPFASRSSAVEASRPKMID